MQQTTVTLSLFFDRRRCARGTRSVKYSIYFKGTQRLIATGILLDEKDVQFIQSYGKAYVKSLSKGKAAPLIQDENQKLIWQTLYAKSFTDPDSGKECVGYLQRANEVVDHLGCRFSFEEFKKHVADYENFLVARSKEQTSVVADLNELSDNQFSEETGLRYDDVLMALMAQYKFMHEEERHGTGDSYKDSAMSLFRFHLHYRNENKDKFKNSSDYSIKFKMLTPSFLTHYERWMYRFGKKARRKGVSPTSASPSTVGIYVRNFRTVYNMAIASGLVDEKSYPFGKAKYIIPTSRNIKKAKTLEEIDKIIEYPCNDVTELLGRDMWLFSYLCYGANMADLLRIRWRDLDGDHFAFLRKKNINTRKKNLTPTEVYLHDLSREIIRRWGQKSTNKNDYIFPFLNTQMSSLEAHKATKAFISRVNDAMAVIAKKLGIKGSMTTYAARHSFATIMLQSGANFVMISGLLAHANTSTTQVYFDDFEDAQVRKAVEALIPKKVPIHKIEPQTDNLPLPKHQRLA